MKANVSGIDARIAEIAHDPGGTREKTFDDGSVATVTKLPSDFLRLVTDPRPFILKYGEQYRGAITETLRWLDEAEIKWSIPRPINRDAYIKFLVTRT